MALSKSSGSSARLIAACTPDTIKAQVQGGTLFGLTAALHGAITFKDGRVEQSDFDSYLKRLSNV
jgi:hypothetical protein